MPPPEVCSNGVDDDGDSLSDCLDPDCAENAACPGGCGEEPEFAVLLCRLGALTVRNELATSDQDFLQATTAILGEGSAAAGEAAAACSEGERRRTRHRLRRLGRKAGAYRDRVRSPGGRQAIPAASSRDALVADVHRIRELAHALRRGVRCPIAP